MISGARRATTHLVFLCVLSGLTDWASGSTPDVTTIPPDLITPQVVSGDPMPGKRVSQALPGYERSKVRHALYLPTEGAGTHFIRKGKVSAVSYS